MKKDTFENSIVGLEKLGYIVTINDDGSVLAEPTGDYYLVNEEGDFEVVKDEEEDYEGED